MAVLVPWHRPPAPRADQLAALRTLPADQVAAGPGVPFGAAPGRLRQPADRPGRRAGARADPARRAADRGGRPAVRRQLGRPGHPRRRSPWSLVADLLTLPFAAWRHTVLPATGCPPRAGAAGRSTCSRATPCRAVIGVVALLGFYAITHFAPRWWWAWGAAGAAGAGGAALVRAAGAGRAGVQQVHPDGRRPAAHRADAARPARRRPGPRRAGGRRVPAHPRGQRLRVRPRPDPADRRLRHPAARGDRRPRWSASSHTSWATRRTATCCTGTLVGALGAALAVVALFLLGGWTGLLRAARASTSIAEPRAFALLVAVVAVAGLVSSPAQAPGLPPDRGAGRRPRARADPGPDDVRGDAAAGCRRSTSATPTRRAGNTCSARPTRPPCERMAAARAYARGERP